VLEKQLTSLYRKVQLDEIKPLTTEYEMRRKEM
jgi:hypothetical protein